MNARVMRAGIAGGIAGGMVMAAISMIDLWLAGSGFWTPLNLIAHTFWRAAPLDGTFSAAALVIGVGVHMTMAILVGTLIAAAAYRLPTARSLVIAGGMLFAALPWAVMQYGIWRAIDAAAAQASTGWVFAVAHLLFGMMAASFAAVGITDSDTPYQPAHRKPAGPGGRLPRPRQGRPPALPGGRETELGRGWVRARLSDLSACRHSGSRTARPGRLCLLGERAGLLRTNGMPWLGGTTGPGKRASARPGEGELSTRARVIAGAMAALAVLAVLAAAARAGSGPPASKSACPARRRS
jgi:hypothetical protein